MQTIQAILQVGAEQHKWTDAYGVNTNTPRIVLGANAALLLDLRTDPDVDSGSLPPYSRAELQLASSWYIALDIDYDQSTMPVLLRTAGISLLPEDDTGRTLLSVELPNTDTPAMRAAVKSAQTLNLRGEIGGYDGEGNLTVCIQFPLVIVNRVYLPGDTPADIVQNPDYYTALQTNAAIAAAIRDALEEYEAPAGAPGPATDITLGTITYGDTPAATLTPHATLANTKVLSLVLPVVDAAPPPSFSIGSVTTGSTPSASLTVDQENGNAYVLSLVVPAVPGISPKATEWSPSTTYAKGDAVRHASAWYISLADGNLAATPSLSPDAWALIVKDGAAGPAAVFQFSPDASAWHNPPNVSTDRFYRISVDGGITFGAAIPLAMPSVTVAMQFNPSPLGWHAGTAGTSYTTAHGNFIRVLRNGEYTQSLQLFGTTNAPVDPALEVHAVFSNDGTYFHPAFEEGDTTARITNPDDGETKLVNLTNTSTDLVTAFEFAPASEPWHDTYQDGDHYARHSNDNGAAFSAPWPLHGLSAYQIWLAQGNTGDEDDFLESIGLPDAPDDGKLYARRNGQWVEVAASSGSGSSSGTGGSDEPAATSDSVLYGCVPYSVAGSITNVSQLTQAMLEDQGTDAHTAAAEAASKSFGTCPAGGWLYVLIPASSSLIARKYDGISSFVPFGTGVPVDDTEANGASVTIDGTAYKLYGEWTSITAEYSFQLTPPAT